MVRGLSPHQTIEELENALASSEAAAFLLDKAPGVASHNVPNADKQFECAEVIRNLTTALTSRFLSSYSQNDLDRAIWLLENLIQKMHSHHFCLIWKSSLGDAMFLKAYTTYYWSSSERSRLDSLQAFQRSFTFQTEAIISSLQHSEMFFKSGILGFFVPNMFGHLGRALSWFRVNHLLNREDNNPDLSKYLDTDRLSQIVGTRADDSTKSVTYIELCEIQLRRMAVEYTPRDDVGSYIRRLVSYAPTIKKDDNFSNLKALDDLKNALEQRPESHPQNAELSAAIGYKLDLRLDNKQAAIPYYLAALNNPAYDVDGRLGAGSRLFKMLRTCQEVKDWPLACDIARKVVELVPQQVALQVNNIDRQRALRILYQQGISGLVCDAVYIGVRTKGPVWALELMEEGRGHMAASILELRTRVDDLPESLAPETVQEFLRLQKTLVSTRAQTSDRHRARVRFDRLCSDIRQTPGYHSFPNHFEIKDILAAATHGPIVLINVPEAADGVCDAILIPCDHEGRIRHLQLHGLYPSDIRSRQSGLGHPECLPEILAWLWKLVAKPILDELGFREPQPDDVENWPRVWWIPTGALAQFPIHAAGNYDRSSKETVLDRVMSSYSPSLKALIQARRNQDESSASKDRAADQFLRRKHGEALVVAMPTTPGLPYLENAGLETEMVRDLCDAMQLKPSPEKLKPTKEAVLSYLIDHTCEVFHFAGHGLTDTDDPSQSGLLLKDGVCIKLSLLCGNPEIPNFEKHTESMT